MRKSQGNDPVAHSFAGECVGLYKKTHTINALGLLAQGGIAMSDSLLRVPRKAAPLAAAFAAGLLLSAASADARVTRIVIDSTANVNNQPAYEQLTGRAF